DLCTPFRYAVLEPVEQTVQHIRLHIPIPLELDFRAQMLELGGVEEVQRLLEVVAVDQPGYRRLTGLHGRWLRLALHGAGSVLTDERQLQTDELRRRRARDLEPFRQRIDVAVLEARELLLPQQRHHVVIGALILYAGTVDHVEEPLDLVLEARQERDEADAVLEEQERHAVATFARGEAAVVPAESALLDADGERRDTIPESRECAFRGRDEASVNGIVRLV